MMAIKTTKMTALKDASMPVVVMAFCARGSKSAMTVTKTMKTIAPTSV